MTGPIIGELFAGYGGLGLAVQMVYGGTVRWVSEFDEAPSRVLSERIPHAPNLGDITQIERCWGTASSPSRTPTRSGISPTSQ